MKKIKVIIKSNILGFIVGAILFGSIGAYAASIQSSDVIYDNKTSKGSSTNVKGSLDELYTKINQGNATAANITKGKTALVQGKLITGTGEDTSKETIKVLTNFYASDMKEYTYKTGNTSTAYIAYHKYGASYDGTTLTGPKVGKSNPIYLYKDPDNNYGVVTAIVFTYHLDWGAEYGSEPYSTSGTLDVKLKTEKGTVLDKIYITSGNHDNTVTWTPSDYKINDGSEYIYIDYNLNTSAWLGDQGRVNVTISISDAKVKYIPLS